MSGRWTSTSTGCGNASPRSATPFESARSAGLDTGWRSGRERQRTLAARGTRDCGASWFQPGADGGAPPDGLDLPTAGPASAARAGTDRERGAGDLAADAGGEFGRHVLLVRTAQLRRHLDTD